MNSPVRLAPTALFIFLTAALWGMIVQPALAIEDLPLQYDWYRIELILFERPAANEDNTAETLLTQEPRKYPPGLIALRADDETLAHLYQLTAAARIELTYPTVTVNQMAQLGQDAATGADATVAATELPGSTDALEAEEPADPEAPIRAALELWERSQLATSYTSLVATAGDLTAAAKKLQRSSDYRLIDHLLWSQPVPARDKPVNILLQLGARKQDSWQYEGYLAITLGRYLHVDTTLWYQPFDEKHPGYMLLEESRRMRSKTLHYLDHPKFGLLLQIDTIQPPPELVSQWQAVEESQQQ